MEIQPRIMVIGSLAIELGALYSKWDNMKIIDILKQSKEQKGEG